MTKAPPCPDGFSLEGRCALVTGGSSGIGAAIAELFARHGASVVVCHHRDGERARALCSRLEGSGAGIWQFDCDVSDGDRVASLASFAERTAGRVDIVVNSAGIGGALVHFEEMQPAVWDRMLDVHLRGTMLVTRAFFAPMMARRWGRVINISSQLARKGAVGHTHYCAAKAGIEGFTRALAHEGAPHGVLVNAIAPGPVETPLLLSLPEEWRQNKRRELPLGRLGGAGEIAPTALLLASAAGGFYVGQVLSPNGGDVMP